MQLLSVNVFVFYFNTPAPTELYTLSLHDALPISARQRPARRCGVIRRTVKLQLAAFVVISVIGILYVGGSRSEEHTSELQSRRDLVCRLLLEKKKWIASVQPTFHGES